MNNGVKRYASEEYVDSKIPEFVTDEEALEFVMVMGYVNPLITDSNIIYTNGNNVIYTL
jgi:hypothetical protein